MSGTIFITDAISWHANTVVFDTLVATLRRKLDHETYSEAFSGIDDGFYFVDLEKLDGSGLHEVSVAVEEHMAAIKKGEVPTFSGNDIDAVLQLLEDLKALLNENSGMT